MSDPTTVVLVTADTLRFDAFYEDRDGEPLCPTLRDLADEGVDFTGAYATGSGTSSAFPGLLASAFPLDYGYRGLTDEHEPVAEAVSDAGSRTVGVTSSSHASSLFNYDRGFDVFYENPSYRRDAPNTSSLSTAERVKTTVFDVASSIPVVETIGSRALDLARGLRRDDDSPGPYERAATVTDRAIGHLETEFANYPDRDRFVWVHYMEPHAPYYPPDDVVAEFDTGEYTKEFVNDAWETWKENRPPLWANEDNSDLLTEREREALELFYRVQIRYLDREVGRLVEYLDDTVGFGETTLFFTSDHGEEFFDHGDLGHRAKVYDELVHVPLFAYNDELASATVDEVVSHTDLGPTVVDLLGGTPPSGWQGRSLVPLLEGDGSQTWNGHESVRSEVCHRSGYGGDVDPDEAILKVVTDDWKYIRNNQTDTEELYRRPDVETEANDRIDDDAAAADAARHELRGYADERLTSLTGRTAARDEMSDELRDQLHQLGYIDE